MATAADYLQFSTTQLLSKYQLRNRNSITQQFTVTNIAPNYILTAIIEVFAGADVSPSLVTLQPGEAQTVTLTISADYLETQSPGSVANSLLITAIADPIDQFVAPPALPELPPVPAPKTSYAQVIVSPSGYGFTQVGESTQFSATLYVDGVPTDAQFTWSKQNDDSDTIILDPDTGNAKLVVKSNTNATIVANVVSPVRYNTAYGMARAYVQIVETKIVTTDGPPIQSIGTLTVRISGDTIEGQVDVAPPSSGNTRVINNTTKFGNTLAGDYVITPHIVAINGSNYIPSGGGRVTVLTNQETIVDVTYTKEAVSPTYNLLLELNKSSVRVGETFTVRGSTNSTTSNSTVDIGGVRFNATYTQEGALDGTPTGTPGIYEATFTAKEAGTAIISAINNIAGGAATAFTILPQPASPVYTIRLDAPTQVSATQMFTVNAVLLQDGIETAVPVNISIGGNTYVAPVVTPIGSGPVIRPTMIGGIELTQFGTNSSSQTNTTDIFAQ